MKTISIFLFLAPAIRLFAQDPPPFLFPGDTNLDSVCNYLDLIPVALAFGDTGPRRPVFNSNDWAPQPYLPWDNLPLPESGINRAFANAFTQAAPGTSELDTVNANDLEVIRNNYHRLQFPSLNDTLTQQYIDQLGVFSPDVPPEISIRFSHDTVDVLDTFYAIVEYRALPQTAYTGSLAIALRLHYEPINLEESPPRLLFDTLSPDLIGVGATFDAVRIDRAPPEGVAEVAVAGNNRMPAFQFATREVFAIEYILDMILRSGSADTLTKPFWIEFDVALLVDTFERRILPVLTHSDTIVLRQITSGADEAIAPPPVRLFPQPARDRVTLFAGEPIRQIAIFDALGRRVLQEKGETNQLTFSVDHLPAGLFWLEIATERRRFWQKMVVAR